MGKYSSLVKKLLGTMEKSSVTYGVESVIIRLLEKDNIDKAIEIAEEIHPGSAFASVFAGYLLSLDDFDRQFVMMTAFAGEEIAAQEADLILRRYTGPDGKRIDLIKSIPWEVLEACSKKAMISFFEFVLESNTIESVHIRFFWDYLKKKI